MKRAVLLHQGGRFRPQHFPPGFFAGFRGNARIQAVNRIPQPARQHHIPERSPLRCRFFGGNVGTVQRSEPKFPQPFQRGGFHMAFKKSLAHVLLSFLVLHATSIFAVHHSRFVIDKPA